MGALGHIFSPVRPGSQPRYHIRQGVEQPSVDHAHDVEPVRMDLHGDLAALGGDSFDLHMVMAHEWIICQVFVCIDTILFFCHVVSFLSPAPGRVF